MRAQHLSSQSTNWFQLVLVNATLAVIILQQARGLDAIAGHAIGNQFRQQSRQSVAIANVTVTSKELPQTNLTSSPQRGLIARTSDAIYHALSDIFSRDDADDMGDEDNLKSHNHSIDAIEKIPVEEIFGWPRGTNDTNAQPPTTTTPDPTTTTRTSATTTSSKRTNRMHQPHIEFDRFKDEPIHNPITTTTTTTTTKKPSSSKSTNKSNSRARSTTSTTTTQMPTTTTTEEASNEAVTDGIKPDRNATTEESRIAPAELYNLLNKALKSLEAFKGFTYLNRTTRLARNGDVEMQISDTSSVSLTNGDQMMVPDRLTAEPTTNFDELKVPRAATVAAEKQDIINNGSKFVTREDIHLLCKLLHKRLEESSNVGPTNNLTIKLTPTEQTPLINTRTTQAPPGATTTITTVTDNINNSVDMNESNPLRGGHFVRSLSDLNETQANHLLESILALDTTKLATTNDGGDHASSTKPTEIHEEESGQRLLIDLFNLGLNISRGHSVAKASEYETDDSTSSTVGSPGSSTDARQQPPMSLKIWSKSSVQGGRGGVRMKLVYWLVEPNIVAGAKSTTRQSHNSSDPTPTTRFRVYNASEAGELLDKLDYMQIRRHLEAAKLRPIVLVAAHRRSASESELANSDVEPSVADDSLITVSPPPSSSSSSSLGSTISGNNLNRNKPSNNGQSGQRSSLQVLADRLTNSSFSDNLYLYLILILVLIFLIVLCITVPMLCCKSQRQSPLFRPNMDESQSIFGISGGGGGGGFHKRGELGVSALERRQLEDAEHLRQASDAIWRKLSNSTTTLVKDRSRILTNDGTVEVPILRDHSNAAFADDHQDQVRSTTTSGATGACGPQARQSRPLPAVGVSGQGDKTRQLTKSVQTSEDKTGESPSEHHQQQGADLMLMICRDRHEARSSDTLTKSELVMLKEKLIPISVSSLEAQFRSKQYHQVGSQTSQMSEHDYVNTAAQTGPSIDIVDIRDSSQQLLGGDEKHQHQVHLARQQPLGALGSAGTMEHGPSRFIDSSSSSGDRSGPTSGLQGVCSSSSLTTAAAAGSAAGQYQSSGLAQRDHERRPKMKQLELPQKYGTKVDEIKRELSRIEQQDAKQDPQTTGTYKRFDVI